MGAGGGIALFFLMVAVMVWVVARSPGFNGGHDHRDDDHHGNTGGGDCIGGG